MKKTVALLMAIILVALSASALAAAAWTCSQCGYAYNTGSQCVSCGAYKNGSTSFPGVTVTTNKKLATRTGPGTQYDGAGSFGSAGMSVTVYSIWYDAGNVAWAEVLIGNRRVYTGVSRLNNDKNRLNSVPVCYSQYRSARVTSGSTVFYGPGYSYALQDLSVTSGNYVSIVSTENDWAQVEWGNHRGWVPLSCLSY